LCERCAGLPALSYRRTFSGMGMARAARVTARRQKSYCLRKRQATTWVCAVYNSDSRDRCELPGRLFTTQQECVMRVRTLPSAERLHKLFSYDCSSGEFTWNRRPISDFVSEKEWSRWNCRYAGKRAGCRRSDSSGPSVVSVKLNRLQYPVHSLVWIMFKGPVPDGYLVDHRDHDPWNNRLDNLRLATETENIRHRRSWGNKTGLKGVSPSYRKRKATRFHASIVVNRKSIALGAFATAEEAHAAYCAAARQFHQDFSCFSIMPRS
jgi:hypothetical protein